MPTDHKISATVKELYGGHIFAPWAWDEFLLRSRRLSKADEWTSSELMVVARQHAAAVVPNMRIALPLWEQVPAFLLSNVMVWSGPKTAFPSMLSSQGISTAQFLRKPGLDLAHGPKFPK